ncbi:hypothetical protein SAR03_25870 [Staphylococcus arlettae]|uniref:Uncharacterized protein n=1 Tax=Staphylococcus arlettae TaxID=29378 RepID=A0ABQ0XXW5_9STAP|nr:hypothetical protein SAR03_25870 [Staphylococcus arlettae]
MSIKLILGYQIPLSELQNKLPDINQPIMFKLPFSSVYST